MIKTAAETRGITITDQEVKKLTASLEKAAEASAAVDGSADGLAKQFGEANRKAQEFGNSLKGLSEDQLAKVRDRLREQIQEQQLAGSSADELRKKLADTYGPRTTEQIEAMTGSLGKAKAATEQVAAAKQQLSRGLSAAQKGMQGLNQAAAGLVQGGIGGLLTAVRGLTTAIGALASGALGTVLLPVLATAGTALLALKRAAEDNEKAMAKMWQEAEAKAQLYRETVDAANKETEASQARQKKNLDELGERYQRVAKAREESDARFGRETDRQKRLDLANASTPEERAAVEARYADAERGSGRAQAAITIEESETTLRDLREQVRDVEATRDARRTDAANTRAVSAAAAARAREAREALEGAEAAYQNAANSMGTNFAVSAKEFEEVKQALEQAKITVEQREQEVARTAALAQAADKGLQAAEAAAEERLRALNAKLDEVRAAADAAREEIEDIAVDEQVAKIEAMPAPAAAASGETAPAKEAAGSTAAGKGRAASASSGPRTTMAPVEEADREIAALEGELDAVRTASNRRFVPGVGREEVANLESQLATAREERSRLYSVVASSMEHESRELRKTQRQLKNAREKSQP